MTRAWRFGAIVFRLWPSWIRWVPFRFPRWLPACFRRLWPWPDRGMPLLWLRAGDFYGVPTLDLGRLSIGLEPLRELEKRHAEDA